MGRAGKISVAVLCLLGTLGAGACVRGYDPAAPSVPPLPRAAQALDQGSAWDQSNRAAFYSQDQGSQIMPLAWFKALRRADGTPFAADRLARFGYLENPDSPDNLPVGFTVADDGHASKVVGMTCAACHTREIRVAGVTYRVDGGPAFIDLQGFFTGMNEAAARTTASEAAFAQFARDVLGPDASPGAVVALHAALAQWQRRFGLLVARALPTDVHWGIGRADAVGMILNRLAGLDIGEGPDHTIPDNIRPADAPVRYPFLWNATVQDRTQWPGFAPNGNDLFALVRNLGEVYGVFGSFYPQRDATYLGGVNFKDMNSANFDGLDRLEQMTRRIGRPLWPWPWPEGHDALVSEGKTLFERTDASGQSCALCHGIRRHGGLFARNTWETPQFDVGTDSREYSILGWTGSSGVLAGSFAIQAPWIRPIQPRDSLVTMLGVATAGAIFQRAGLLRDPDNGVLVSVAADPGKNQSLVLAAASPPAPAPAQYKFEARVLQGVWAAAPYLHNGSVPTLADLLEPCARRRPVFDVGSDYDPDRVGLAEVQRGLHSTMAADSVHRDSGQFNCGHEFGTGWSSHQKQAILEYLKTL